MPRYNLAHANSAFIRPAGRTSVVLGRDVTIDSQLFTRDTPLDLRYGFEFWSISYTPNDLFGDKPEHELSLGASLQIQNANIEFPAVDGSARRVNRSLGPVPLTKARGRCAFDIGLWLHFFALSVGTIFNPTSGI